MLKSKNRVTLFNYSYNSFYDFRFSENAYGEQKVMYQNMGFYVGVICGHTFTDIHTIGPPICILYQW